MLQTRVSIPLSNAWTYKATKLHQARPFFPRPEPLWNFRPWSNYQQDIGPFATMNITVTMSLAPHFPINIHMKVMDNTLGTPSPSSPWYGRQQNTTAIN